MGDAAVALLVIFDEGVSRPGWVEAILRLRTYPDRLPSAAGFVRGQSGRNRLRLGNAEIRTFRCGGVYTRAWAARQGQRWRQRYHGIRSEVRGYAVGRAEALQRLDTHA